MKAKRNPILLQAHHLLLGPAGPRHSGSNMRNLKAYKLAKARAKAMRQRKKLGKAKKG